MRRSPIRGTHLAGALLLALALPLSAQSPETVPAEDAPFDDAAFEDDADSEIPYDDAEAVPADASTETSADGQPPRAADPALLDAEMLPRASRSLLLDVVRTSAGYFAVGERGHVLTSDNGTDWTQAAIPTRATLTSVASADGIVWAAGHDGVIVQSTDGGQTWARRRAAPWSYDIADPSEGVPVMDLLFTDARNGFAIGAYSLMLVTTDGGVTWTPHAVSGDGDTAPAPARGMAAAEGDDWTFSQDDLALDAESDPHFNAIGRAGSGALVIAGERGTFLRSRDGGENWESRRLPYEGSMFGVLSWEDDHIMVFGLRGNVYESRNLGNSWTRVETGITTSLMGGHALPGGGAVLVGTNGAVLTRADAASPFTATVFETPGGTPLLSAVLPAGDDGYLVVGDKGAGLYRPQ